MGSAFACAAGAAAGAERAITTADKAITSSRRDIPPLSNRRTSPSMTSLMPVLLAIAGKKRRPRLTAAYRTR